MKNNKMIATMFASMLMLVVCFTASSSFAQAKMDSTMKKDCCMMKDGKMMQMKGGKMMPMEKNMTMKNGTTCTTTGECIMKDGKKMKIKEGDCMEMSGKMMKCMKSSTDSKKQTTVMTFTCPMHPEYISDKQGKCPKCSMDLVEKK